MPTHKKTKEKQNKKKGGDSGLITTVCLLLCLYFLVKFIHNLDFYFMIWAIVFGSIGKVYLKKWRDANPP